MIYIDLSNNLYEALPEECRKLPKFFRKIVYNIRRRLGLLYIKKIDEKTIIIISEINSKSLKRIEKYIKVKCVKLVCLSKEIVESKQFMDFIKGQDVKILEGKWLYSQLIPKIIDYIVQNKKEKTAQQEISFLIKNVNEIWFENIKQIAQKSKLINIVTIKEEKFRRLEKNLYEEKGILLNINNNYKKSLLKSDIIINVDFSEEEINQYSFPKKACIINVDKENKILSKSFEGINIFKYEISLPRKYLKYIISLKNFDNEILYESFIYKITTWKNIQKEINEDEVKILSVNGKNGRIRKSEFIDLSKNKNNFVN